MKDAETVAEPAVHGADVGTTALARFLQRFSATVMDILRTARRASLRDGRVGTSIDAEDLRRRIPESVREHFDLAGEEGLDRLRVDVINGGRAVRISADHLELHTLSLGPVTLSRVVLQDLVLRMGREGRVTDLLRRVVRPKRTPKADVSVQCTVRRLLVEDLEVSTGERIRKGVALGLDLHATGLEGAREGVLDDPDTPIAVAFDIDELAVFGGDAMTWSLDRSISRHLSLGLSQADASIRLQLGSLDGIGLAHDRFGVEGLHVDDLDLQGSLEDGRLRLEADWPPSDLRVDAEIGGARLAGARLLEGAASAGQVDLTALVGTATPDGTPSARAERVEIARGRWADAVASATCAAMVLERVEASTERVAMEGLEAEDVDVAQDLDALIDDADAPGTADAEVLAGIARAVDDAAVQARIEIAPDPSSPVPLRWAPSIDVQARATAEAGQMEADSARVHLAAPRLRFLVFELLGLGLDDDGEVQLDVRNGPDLPLATILETLGVQDAARVPLALPRLVRWALSDTDPAAGGPVLKGAFELELGLLPRVLDVADQAIAIAEPVDVHISGEVDGAIGTRWERLVLGASRAELQAATATIEGALLGEGSLEVDGGVRVRLADLALSHVGASLSEPWL